MNLLKTRTFEVSEMTPDDYEWLLEEIKATEAHQIKHCLEPWQERREEADRVISDIHQFLEDSRDDQRLLTTLIVLKK
jgi:tryptophanyl-tRNA synthetase